MSPFQSTVIIYPPTDIGAHRNIYMGGGGGASPKKGPHMEKRPHKEKKALYIEKNKGIFRGGGRPLLPPTPRAGDHTQRLNYTICGTTLTYPICTYCSTMPAPRPASALQQYKRDIAVIYLDF